jgi:PAS domain S-box-containing protein
MQHRADTSSIQAPREVPFGSEAARLELATRAAALGVWDWDLLDDTLVLSPRAREICGLPQDDRPLRPGQVRARTHPDDVARTEAMLLRALDPSIRERVPYEYRVVHDDGQVYWVLAHGEVMFLPVDGTVRAVRYIGTLQDITERRRLREALQTSEARLKLAQQVAGIGVWDWELARDAITWSPEMYALLGLDPATVSKPFAAWLDVLHPEDRARVESAARRAVAQADTLDIEYRVITAAGVRWIRSQGTSLVGKDGRPVRMIGVIQDITDARRQRIVLEERNLALQKVAEMRLRERERIFDLSRELIAVAGFDGYLKVVNPAWTRIFRHDERTLLGHPFAEFVHPDDRAALAGEIRALRQGNITSAFENRLRCADGNWRWIAWTAVPEGELFYTVGRDITAEKLAAQELEAANRQLRQQIEGRERVEATLRQMQRLEAVGQLTSGVAHDFNNLLTIVLGNLDLIEMAVEDPKVCKRLELIRQAALRGATLTSQLLAFSRRQRLEPKAIDLNDAVAGMSELLKSTVGGRVAVTTRLQPDLWRAMVDPTQIGLVVLNLAINARDAMPGGGELTIETSNATLVGEPQQLGEPAPGEYVAIAVSDTGTGMAEEVRARVFEPFFTTKEVGQGSGLGLPQMLGFAQQSGGGVRIESALGVGTTVRVYLPRARADAAEDTHARAVPPPSATAQRRRALLVDDDSAVREVTAARLRRLGFEVLEAGSGGAALDLLDRSPQVDLLVADFAMPGMNGVEVAHQACSRRPGLPVLFVTGYADESALAGVGDQCVVQKPFRDDELERKVQAVLGR